MANNQGLSSIAPPYEVLITTPVLLTGGTEVQTLYLVKSLMSAGYHITVCCYYEYEDSMVSKMEATGADVILMNLRRSDGIVALMINLWKIFKKLGPDSVHVQYVAPGFIPVAMARLSGIKKVFATVHQPGRVYGLREKLLIRMAAFFCDAFFCNSKCVEESWFGSSEIFDPGKTDPKRKHFTIYNGVDILRIEKIVKGVDKQEIIESLKIKNKKVVGVVGRLRTEKGQATLMESMKIVIKKLPNTVLLVVGDGPDRVSLEDLAGELGISDHVKWLGQKDPEEVIKLFSIMDAVAVPSVFEGFGLVAVEAMAAGRPVVASNVDGLTELIQGGVNGLLVQPGDSSALARGVLEILLNPAKATSMGVHGREMVEKQLPMTRFHSTILAAYSHYTEKLN